MHTQTKSNRGVRSLPTKLALLIAMASVFALAATTQASATTLPTLPAPEIVSGLTEGQILNVDNVDVGFDLAGTITGGSVLNYLCSLDGAPFTVCTSPNQLVALSAGAHNYQVKAVVQLAGGAPVCILGICVDPGPVTVETDVKNLTFSVDLGGSSIGSTGITGSTGGNGSNGSNGSNGANGANGTNAAQQAAVAAALKKQTNRCTKLKRKLRKHFTKRSNRLRVRKRYVRCIKVQKKLAAKQKAVSG